MQGQVRADAARAVLSTLDALRAEITELFGVGIVVGVVGFLGRHGDFG